MKETVTVAIIDDDRAVRKSLARLLVSSGVEAQEYTSAEDFLEKAAPETLSCVVTDLRMREMNGQQLQSNLRSKFSYLPFIFITGYGDIPTTVEVMRGGAVDFLEKPVKSGMLLKAVRAAIRYHDELLRETTEIEQLKLKYGSLTPRERQVFALVSAGLLNKQIAAELGAAEKTIKQHRGSVMRKMKAESLASLVLMAERLGIRAKNEFAAAKGKLAS